jgi:hypothetical protein
MIVVDYKLDYVEYGFNMIHYKNGIYDIMIVTDLTIFDHKHYIHQNK